MSKYSPPSESPTFTAVYPVLLARAGDRALDASERRRVFDLLLQALQLWEHVWTGALEREIGMLLLDQVDDVHVVRELGFVLHRRASPASERMLLEAMRRALEGRHDASFVALVFEVIDWIGAHQALPDAWAERAIELALPDDDDITAILAVTYLRCRPARAPWLADLVRHKTQLTHAACADIDLLFLVPTVAGVLEWASRGDCVVDEELPLHAPWVQLHELDVTMSRVYALGDAEQCAQIAAWAGAIRKTHGSTALPILHEVESDVVVAACAATTLSDD